MSNLELSDSEQAVLELAYDSILSSRGSGSIIGVTNLKLGIDKIVGEVGVTEVSTVKVMKALVDQGYVQRHAKEYKIL